MYDKSGEEHYNLISALHKSVRNSDPDAALYWLARMFAAGEDPLYLARRVVRMAVEDIGLAAPEALEPMPVGQGRDRFSRHRPKATWRWRKRWCICALAPKSNAVYTAYGAVQEDVEHTRAGAGAAASAQRADAADEVDRLRRGDTSTRTIEEKVADMSACPKPEGPRLLPSHRRGHREAHQSAAGRDSQSKDESTTKHGDTK